MGLDHANETVHALHEMRTVQKEVAMLAAGFPKEFGFVGGGEIFFGVMESGQAVASTMDDHHRNVDAGQLRAGVVSYGRNQAHRQPGKKFGADVGYAGKG